MKSIPCFLSPFGSLKQQLQVEISFQLSDERRWNEFRHSWGKMTNIRRYFTPGNYYFLTHVTHNRKPVLNENFDLLWRASEKTQYTYLYDLIAWVVLPDHMHLLINPKNAELPGVIRKIKLGFSYHYREKMNIRNGRIWQNRYRDHIIRNDADLNNHIDYIHYNPVKHGLVKDPFEHKYSSLQRHYEQGMYERNWGIKGIIFDGDFGE